MELVLLLIVLFILFGASLFTALFWLVKVLLFVALAVVLWRVITGHKPV